MEYGKLCWKIEIEFYGSPYVDMPGWLQEKASEIGDFEECG